MRSFISGCSSLTLTDAERTFFRDADPWGFILFKRNIDTPAQVLALTQALRECVGRDAPILIDQEGGRVQRMGPPHWPAYPPMRTYGEIYERDPDQAIAAAREGALSIARDLKAVGIDVDCLPLLDVPIPGAHDIIGDRAYSENPHVVAALGRATAEGLMEGGVTPIIKHIPGHGRAQADSHEALPVVTASRAELEASDFLPFKALADMPLAMTAHIVYTALDPDHPATTSPFVIHDIIRGALGFKGLIMSDDLSMKALKGTMGERVDACLHAGCDLVLHCNGDMSEMWQVAEAAKPFVSLS